MEDSRWLRLMTIGLVLAALAVGYFLISGRFSSKTAPSASPVATSKPSVLGQTAGSSPTPTPIPASAYERIVSRNQGVQTLPRTGFPAGLAVVLAVSAVISGWGLRKFPH